MAKTGGLSEDNCFTNTTNAWIVSNMDDYCTSYNKIGNSNYTAVVHLLVVALLPGQNYAAFLLCVRRTDVFPFLFFFNVLAMT
jgi:hypothetical protein